MAGDPLMGKKYIVIVGGKLQGVEALYLAQKAGIETVLIDRNPFALGQKFCNRFICQDVVNYTKDLLLLFQNAAFVLPALENQEALQILKTLSDTHQFRLIYDEYAYGISSSKILSDKAMAELHLPAPKYYPDGNYPYVAKPSTASCSQGVQTIGSEAEMAAFLADHSRDCWVVQEFVQGPSYSIEIIGTPGNYSTYHITELFMDEGYDCKRVISRPDFPRILKNHFQTIAISLGEMVQLNGIMDVEVIENGGELKILEIDARIPSQTPITVYHATGLNMIEEMYRKFYDPSLTVDLWEEERYVSLEQIAVSEDAIKISGEHIMTHSGILSLKEGFCGADEAITDYAPDSRTWNATLINIADSAEALERKRVKVLESVRVLQGGKPKLIDSGPKL